MQGRELHGSQGLYAKKVPGTENSASDVGIRAIPVRLFLLNSLISGYIESAIDRNLKKEIFIRKENKMAYRQNNSQGHNDRVRFELMERIGVLSRKDNGWTREVNIVAWNDGPGKVDIREWDPDHKRMTKGVTLFEEEAETLTKILARRYGLTHSERSFGELTASPKGRTYIEPAGGSAAGQDDIFGAVPAAGAASVPEAAACVAEDAAQMDAAAPATA